MSLSRMAARRAISAGVIGLIASGVKKISVDESLLCSACFSEVDNSKVWIMFFYCRRAAEMTPVRKNASPTIPSEGNRRFHRTSYFRRLQKPLQKFSGCRAEHDADSDADDGRTINVYVENYVAETKHLWHKAVARGRECCDHYSLAKNDETRCYQHWVLSYLPAAKLPPVSRVFCRK